LLLAAFSVTALGISSRGTSSGTIACHAGLFIADPMFSRNVNSSSVTGVITPRNVSTASTATATSIQLCQKISSLRRS
jgi:hypothetical protein